MREGQVTFLMEVHNERVKRTQAHKKTSSGWLLKRNQTGLMTNALTLKLAKICPGGWTR